MKQILLCIFISLLAMVEAQKKPLDHSVYDSWKQIGNLYVSDKGNIVSFEVQPQEGDGKLVLRKVKSGTEISIDRGYNATITPDEAYAVCLIKPFFKDTRKAKIKKAKPENMPKDSIAVVSLITGKIVRYPSVVSYQMGDESLATMAFLSSDTSLVSKADRKRKEIGKPLIVYHFATQKKDTIRYVDQYAFDKSGKSLVVTVKDTTKQSSAVLFDVPGSKSIKIIQKKAFVSLPEFDDTGKKLLFLTSTDTVSSGTKKCELRLFHSGLDSAKVLISKDYKANLPEGWALNENSRPGFSKNGNRIFVGIAPVQTPKDTTLVSFETAGLDLWNYADLQLPPVQLKNLKADLKRTCLASYNDKSGELIPLTSSFFDFVRTMDEGNSAQVLSVDNTNSAISTQWDAQNPKELSLVSVADGKRTPIATGRFSSISTSPDGKFLLWFNLSDSQWYLYDIYSAATRCMTKELEVNFWDEESDEPQLPEPYGVAGFTNGDKAVLIYDRYDIWSLPTDGGKPVNITGGEGRSTNRVYRYISLKERRGQRAAQPGLEDKEFVNITEPLLLSVFDKTTKKQGYARLSLKNIKQFKPALNILDGFTFALLKKAKDVNVFAYSKANFQTSPDVYVTSDDWKNEKRLSDINPQMKDYSWGTAELVKWTAYDGTLLEGLLYKPEGFDPNKKYPVMIYFYERNSDKLYSHYVPAPSRSIINISFYCSRGYLVFVPDIVYKTGLPGESAYNCIVSGAESLARNAWVDKENMAIQGQSWGGYQVAYLVTRTNMFKAAGAGAPVANMTSAYGGIRWGTGISRQFQYEHTQSRIGRTLWEAPELYIANSPLFKADKVETPLLMMHNDADGAVPWYQGIEYFMALRRLGKKVWMLQYNDEDHNLTERRNMKDLTIRLQQYFDYYLKGEPMPAWMKNGIPASRKGQYFGLENAE